MREALFSRWSQLVGGAFFVDLFCGGGAVGLEALSRGARRTLFVDVDGRRLATARRNAEALGVSERCDFRRASLPEQWHDADGDSAEGAPLLLFADPPYDFGEYEVLARRMQEHRGVTAMAIEHSVRCAGQIPWSSAVRRDYGESSLTLWARPAGRPDPE